MRYIFVVISLALILAACMPLAACTPGMDFPTADQVEANVPTALRSCPGLPNSPGSKASNRETARYIIKLHRVAVECRKRNSEVDGLLKQYEGEIAMYKNIVEQTAK